MMNKIKSGRLQLVKFLFIFPLLAVTVLAFRNGYRAGTADKKFESAKANGKMKTGLSVPTAWNGLKPGATKNRKDIIPGKEVIAEIRKGVGDIPSKEMVGGRDSAAPQRLNDTVRFASGGGFVTGHLENVLYIIDNEKMPADFVPEKYTLGKDDISSISILKNKAASLYGESKCRDVIVITTNRPPPNSNHKGVGIVTLGVPFSEAGKVEYYINGLISDAQEAKKVDPYSIASIRVGSGIRDLQKNAHYAVWIELKKKIQPGDSSKSVFRIDTLDDDPQPKSTGIAPFSSDASKSISFSGGSSLSLGVSNISHGSLIVLTRGRPLQENADAVDYRLGTVAILNAAILKSGAPINVVFEDKNRFNAGKDLTVISNLILQNDTRSATH